MSAAEATAAGYHALAGPFNSTLHEQRAMQNVIADLQRGGIAYVLVSEKSGTAVYRRGWIEAPAC